MYDLIIIGSGGAGLTAALSAKEQNKKVLVVTKNLPTHSQTCQAQGGINAVINSDNDSIETHVNDTYTAGAKLASKSNLKYLCENANEAIKWLDEIGVPFTRNNHNEISQRRFGGSENIRTCYSSDYTGLKILHTLYDNCINKGIEFLCEHQLIDLILDEYKLSCRGVSLLNIKDTSIVEIEAKNVILATGGYAGIYSQKTTNSLSNTADGIYIAYKNGVELSNMEFIQFHPTTLKNTNILISESARGEGGYLVTQNHDRFIDELKTRDEISRAITDKINKNEKVYLDLRHLGKDKIKSLIPQERKLAYEFSNIRLEEDLLEIEPASHYTMGGIKTDLNGQTSLKNLFAVGECAQANLHGANRLGGNSLLELIVMGKRVGSFASNNPVQNEYETKTNNEIIKSKIDNLFKRENEENLYKIKDEISDIMFDKVGLYRSKNSLFDALNFILNTIKNIDKIGIDDKTRIYNKNLIDLIELENILYTSKLVILSSLHRNESRGSHFRIDFKYTDRNLELNTIVKKIDSMDSIYYEDIK